MIGKINKNSTSISGTINSTAPSTGSVTSAAGGTSDHKRLANRSAADQHPISAITNLQDILDSKATKVELDELKAQLTEKRAKGLYYDFNSTFAKKPYWYLVSEVDSETGQGIPGDDGRYIVSGPYDLGQGGGGGGSGGGITTVTLVNRDPETSEYLWPTAVAIGADVNLKVYWSSKRDEDPTGNGTMFVYVNDILVEKKNTKQGLYECNVSNYLISGANKIEFKIQDAYSTTKNLIGTINAVSLKLTSKFEDDTILTGLFTYTYIPVGDVLKLVHFIVDGVEIGVDQVRTSNEQCTRVFQPMSHGSHTLEVYFTAEIDGDFAESNHLKYDLIAAAYGNTTPIIASTFPAQSEQEQYVAYNIKYRVYTPTADGGHKNTSIVKLFIDGQQVGSDLSVNTSWQNWEIIPTVVGNHIYTIQTGSVQRIFNAHVFESTINVQPIETSQVLYLTTSGRSNAEALESRVVWEDAAHDIHCNLTGFNWSANGWLSDSTGTTVLRLSGDARVEIPYQPFYKDVQQTGKTIEIEFATSDVKKYESRILECLTGGDSLTYSQALAGEDDRAHYFTVTDVNSEKFVQAVRGDHRTYLFLHDGTNWTLDGEVVDLSQDNIYGISIRMEDRAGGTPSEYFIEGDRITVAYLVVGRGIYITPQLAKFQSQLSALSTQYKENERVYLTFVIEKRAENRLIYMYINGIMSGVSVYPLGDTFEQNPAANIILGSNDATLDIYTIRIYDNSLNRKQVVNNWIASMRDPQTRAAYYQENDNFNPETGKVVISKIPSKTPYMVLTGPELPGFKKDKKLVDVEFVYPGSDERYFTAPQAQIDVQGTSSQYYYRKNFKINFKEGFYDIDKEYHEKYKHIPPLSKKEKKFTFKADVASSEGANNVQLVRYFELTKNWLMPAEKDQDADDTADGYLTKDRIRTGIDGFPMIMFHNNGAETYFYGKMNFNNDKDNKSTFGFSDGDECWEFVNNTTPLVLFEDDDLSNWQISFESRYPEEYGEDDHAYGTKPGELDKLQAVMSWVVSTKRLPTDSDEEKARKLQKFRDEFEDHFNLQSSLFYYLYTELFLMVDSRAKNAMLAYLKSHTPGDKGNRWFWLPYDMDTAIGTNNEGLLVFNYDAEDTDIVNGANVYNGQASVFWNNLRDAFPTELKQLYRDLRSGAAGGDMKWSYDNIEKLFEDHQSYWSASIFNEDSYTKYLEPLINNNDATYLGMAQGSKEEQRKWWLWNRFRYLDSKYRTGDAQDQYIMLRAYARDNLVVTPYINCYVTGVFDQVKDESMVTVDALKDTAYTIVPPETWDPARMGSGGSDSVVAIYSADLLRDVGDLSGFKLGYADFSRATKLQRLQIGSTAPGYTNNKLETLNVGNNHLLTYLDARNCSALGTGDTKIVDLSNCNSIEEVYFDNTNIQGVMFPVGGNLKKVHLPASITDLTIRSHPNLNELKLYGTDNLTSVWLEDIPSSSISAVEIISAMDEGATARLININETIDSVETLENFYDKLWTMKGKDNKGDTTDKAQITGIINLSQLTNISYADWVRLSAMFPEVEIRGNIICNVNFWNDDVLYATRNVILGRAAVAPEMPSRTPTAQYYYTFAGWDGDFSTVTQDLDIHATYDEHIQVYHIIFDVRSEVIELEQDTFDLEYGSAIPEPVIIQETIPEGVNFLGWHTANNDLVDFNTITVSGDIINFPETKNIIISARWQDENAPLVTLSRISYNKFAYRATDNLGIVAYAITDSEVLTPIDERWHLITSTTLYEGEHTINATGDYYFHVKDDQGNTSWAKITAYEVNVIQNINNEFDSSTNIIQVTYSEQADLSNQFTTVFALSGTKLYIDATNDSHYENLSLKHNAAVVNIGDSITVNQTIVIMASVTPKVYRVTFDINLPQALIESLTEEQIEAMTPWPQDVIYKHKVIEPEPQSLNGYILDAWKTIDDELWSFASNVILGALTLYAVWAEYSDPTTIVIDTTEENQEVHINLWQETAMAVKVVWGDNTGEQAINEAGGVTFTHTYSDANTYSIQVYRYAGNYHLGWNFDTPAVQPINIVSDVIFAFDVAYTNPGAFRGATHLSTIRLTRFMTKIADSTFEDCTGAVSFDGGTYNIPNSIQNIGGRAFAGCTGLTRVTLPSKLQVLGDNVFRGCTNLTNITFSNECTLAKISAYAFYGCSSLSTINIPGSVTTIGENAFGNCIALSELYLGTNVTTINSEAFANCSSLEYITIMAPHMITMDRDCFYGCSLLETAGPISGNYNIKFGWTQVIPANAFNVSYAAASALRSITLPLTIEEIGDNAFYDCQYLNSINYVGSTYDINIFPNSLRIIGNSCFNGCASLQNITIPSSVESMGDSVFRSCRGLTRAYLYLASSSHKIDSPLCGWFYNTRFITQPDGSQVQQIEIHVPNDITEGQDDLYYGAYWNCHIYDGTSQPPTIIMLAYISDL